jgi:formate-dependent phosphoribosylglycinamide formyltransferase (GAR transformylase)
MRSKQMTLRRVSFSPNLMTYTKKIVLLGRDELGREFTISAKCLGAYVVACASYAGAPAMQARCGLSIARYSCLR